MENIKTVAIKWNLDNESDRKYYEKLMALDGGAFPNAATYVKNIVINHLKVRKEEKTAIDYKMLVKNLIETMQETGEEEIEPIYSEILE